MRQLAVLLSGSGRTLDNFHKCIEEGSLSAKVEVVISNVESALGLEKARKYGYPAYFAPDNAAINKYLSDYSVDVICLAGFLNLYLPPEKYRKAVLNIHPSLIPSFCGEGYYGHKVHHAVKDRGCMISGCTVHFANQVYDEGPIVVQKSVQLDYEDDVEAIAAKVFELECDAFPEAINLVDKLGIDYFWSRVAR